MWLDDDEDLGKMREGRWYQKIKMIRGEEWVFFATEVKRSHFRPLTFFIVSFLPSSK